MGLGTVRLRRLERIRRLAAAQDRVELEAAVGLLRQVDARLTAQVQAGAASRVLGRKALAVGERGNWLLAEAAGEVAGWNVARLEGVRAARGDAAAAARERYVRSHREEEQMGMLVEAAKATAAREEARREQMEADDWFSRRFGRRRG